MSNCIRSIATQPMYLRVGKYVRKRLNWSSSPQTMFAVGRARVSIAIMRAASEQRIPPPAGGKKREIPLGLARYGPRVVLVGGIESIDPIDSSRVLHRTISIDIETNQRNWRCITVEILGFFSLRVCNVVR